MPASKYDLDVDERLGRLLGQGESLHDFASWFMDALWSIELSQDDRDVALAGRIQNRLFGFSSGFLSVDELMADLREDAV